jgi:hypothetical protein
MTITLTREEAQQVLDALNEYVSVVVSVNDPDSWTPKVADGGEPARKAIETLRARLSAPEPEQCSMCGSVHSAYIRRCAGCGHMKGLENPEWSKSEPEPVAWMEVKVEAGFEEVKVWREPVSSKSIPLYPAPPQREWQGLTDEEIKKEQHHIDWTNVYTYAKFARAIEAKLREKNA